MSRIVPTVKGQLLHDGVKVEPTSKMTIIPGMVLEYHVGTFLILGNIPALTNRYQAWDSVAPVANPRALVERSIRSSEKQRRDPRFRSKVLERDLREVVLEVDGKKRTVTYNWCCLLEPKPGKLSKLGTVQTMAMHCQAIYILPYCKHDAVGPLAHLFRHKTLIGCLKYVAKVTRHSRTNVVFKIDDVRNGMMLRDSMHKFLGYHKVNGIQGTPRCSFICVPNEYLQKKHMKYSSHPADAQILTRHPKRATVQFHLFDEALRSDYGLEDEFDADPPRLWNGKLLKEPEDEEKYHQRIPSAIWDHHYASAVLSMFADRGPAFEGFADFCDKIYEEGGGQAEEDDVGEEGVSDYSGNDTVSDGGSVATEGGEGGGESGSGGGGAGGAGGENSTGHQASHRYQTRSKTTTSRAGQGQGRSAQRPNQGMSAQERSQQNTGMDLLDKIWGLASLYHHREEQREREARVAAWVGNRG
ncbi:hypothetical protein VNI00_005144 [Paramarasmius palmivorus]|uniref:HNH nuclease domain-containing protein n=1 Tax=Paramarasmius palmivorus TaxID=297713 RepID=A0AAW0DHJ1_9AGAR